MMLQNILADSVTEVLPKQRAQQAFSQWKCSEQVSFVTCQGIYRVQEWAPRAISVAGHLISTLKVA